MEELNAQILDELSKYPLTPSAYHRKLGAGASITFGLVPRRGLDTEISPISFIRAKLYKMLVELGIALRVPSYSSITIQHNYTLVRRKEKSGGKAHLVLLGSYEDTGVRIGTKREMIEALGRVLEVDTTKDSLIPSTVTSGDRYLILYHSLGDYTPTFEVSSTGSVNLSGELSALTGQQNKFWVEQRKGVIQFD